MVMTSSQMPLTAGKPEHQWWILAVLATAQLMVALDATVVSIALPHAQASLHFSSADRQWIVAAHALAFTTADRAGPGHGLGRHVSHQDRP